MVRCKRLLRVVSNNLNDQSGFSLVEILVSTAIATATMAAVIGITRVVERGKLTAQSLSGGAMGRHQVFSMLSNEQALMATIQDPYNHTFACLREKIDCRPLSGISQTFRLLDRYGEVLYDPLSSAAAGIGADGEFCNEYLSSRDGSARCPFRMNLSWQPVCPPLPALCIDPIIKVAGLVEGTHSSSLYNINAQQFNFNLYVTPPNIIAPQSIKEIANLSRGFFAVYDNGSAKAWGSNDNGNLGINNATDTVISTPTQLLTNDGDTLFGIDLFNSYGSSHNCNIHDLGPTMGVKCRGWHGHGALGKGPISFNSYYSTTVVDINHSGPQLDNVMVLGMAESAFNMAFTSDVGFVGWGENRRRRIASSLHAEGEEIPYPVISDWANQMLVNFHPGALPIDIAGTGTNTCALLEDPDGMTRVKCWGCGFLGNGPRTACDIGADPTTDGLVEANNAVTVKGPGGVGELSNVVKLRARNHYHCALLEDTRLVCWGKSQTGRSPDDGFTGRLGNGVAPDDSDVEIYPNFVVGPGGAGHLTGVKDFELNYIHACAILDTNEIYCWGHNDGGRLGRGTCGGKYSIPQKVVGINGLIPLDLAVSSRTTCALFQGDDVRCWGKNSRGELGIGSSDGDCHPSPEPVQGL